MENKYYKVTSLEELYIGLECRIQSSYGWQEGKWPEVLMKDSLTAQDYIDNGVVLASSRAGLEIKYLDKEDIEELGWTKSPAREYYDISVGIDEYQLHYQDDHYMMIYDGSGNFVFRGYIKNKSELSRLMKQLFQ